MKPHKVSAHSDKFYLHFFLLVVWLSRNFVSFHKIHFKTAPTASTQALANCKIIHLENWAAEKEDFFFFVRIKVIPNTFLITSLYTYSFGHALSARIIRKCSCVHCTSYSSLTYFCWCVYDWSRWSSYILRRPQNFAKSSPYFCSASQK